MSTTGGGLKAFEEKLLLNEDRLPELLQGRSEERSPVVESGFAGVIVAALRDAGPIGARFPRISSWAILASSLRDEWAGPATAPQSSYEFCERPPADRKKPR
jgi:hypothetical protein